MRSQKRRPATSSSVPCAVPVTALASKGNFHAACDANWIKMKPAIVGAEVWIRVVPLACIVSLLLGLSPRVTAGQLRPLEPVRWEALTGASTARAGMGIGVLTDQRASLAGTRGTLVEIGNWFITYRSGRLALEFSGTAVRWFEDEDVLTPPFVRTDPSDGNARTDAGDVRIATLLRLFGESDAAMAGLRFGTRLPTPSDEPGLDRDRTDFFATAIGRARVHGAVYVFGEAGVGIHSTIVEDYPQSDVLIYNAGIEAASGAGGVRVQVLGHDDLHRRVIRGNEDLAELRFGGWLGERRRIEVHAVRGLADFSPRWGVLLMGGIRVW